MTAVTAAEKDQLAAEKDQLAAEKDQLAAEKDQLAAEKDQLFGICRNESPMLGVCVATLPTHP